MDERFLCPQCGTELLPTCFYCGEITEDSAIAVESHIVRCEKHPIRKLYEERDDLRHQLAESQAEVERLRRLLLASCRQYHGSESMDGKMLQWVGVYHLRWYDPHPEEPTCGFVEWTQEEIDEALLGEGDYGGYVDDPTE